MEGSSKSLDKAPGVLTDLTEGSDGQETSDID